MNDILFIIILLVVIIFVIFTFIYLLSKYWNVVIKKVQDILPYILVTIGILVAYYFIGWTCNGLYQLYRSFFDLQGKLTFFDEIWYFILFSLIIVVFAIFIKLCKLVRSADPAMDSKMLYLVNLLISILLIFIIYSITLFLSTIDTNSSFILGMICCSSFGLMLILYLLIYWKPYTIFYILFALFTLFMILSLIILINNNYSKLYDIICF